MSEADLLNPPPGLDPPAASLPPVPVPARPPASARGVLLASVGLTLLLYMLPFGDVLAQPLILLSTLAHELGHGVTAFLLGGDFLRFRMWLDGSGVAEMDLSGFGRFRQALTIAGGLVGPAVAAAICFALGRTVRGARLCLVGLGVFLTVVVALLVRNLFGFFFVGLLAAGCLVLAAKVSPRFLQWIVVFTGVQLALSVFSRADYLFTPVAHTSEGVYPSDVGQMATALFLPYWIWGFLCGAFSIAVLLFGLRSYWTRTRVPLRTLP